MSLQFSGGPYVDTSFISDGTRLQLVNQLETALVAAGWNVISGAGSADWIYESDTTPQGLKIRLEGKDAGGATVSAQFYLRSDSVVIASPAAILPRSGGTFRVWASPYQFMMLYDVTDSTQQRSFIMGGVPWVPDFVQDDIGSNVYYGWLHTAGVGDAGTGTLATTFRFSVGCGSAISTGAPLNCFKIEGASQVLVNSAGFFGLLWPKAVADNQSYPAGAQWRDGTFRLVEPILIMPLAMTVTQPTVMWGQLWDAVVSTKAYAAGATRAFEGHSWRNITHLANATWCGSLLLATS